MPLYTYRCENCGIEFDKQQKFSDQALTRCPECGKKSLHKVYSPVGIVFKGSGFYATDHRSPSGMAHTPKADEKGDGAKLGKDKPKGDKSTETKSSVESSSVKATTSAEKS